MCRAVQIPVRSAVRFDLELGCGPSLSGFRRKRVSPLRRTAHSLTRSCLACFSSWLVFFFLHMHKTREPPDPWRLHRPPLVSMHRRWWVLSSLPRPGLISAAADEQSSVGRAAPRRSTPQTDESIAVVLDAIGTQDTANIVSKTTCTADCFGGTLRVLCSRRGHVAATREGSRELSNSSRTRPRVRGRPIYVPRKQADEQQPDVVGLRVSRAGRPSGGHRDLPSGEDEVGSDS